MNDLVVLVADNEIKLVVDALLDRPKSIGIRRILWKTIKEQDHDPGCVKRGVTFLSGLKCEFRHALLIFDYEGCGVTNMTSQELQVVLNTDLEKNWGCRARTIILNPELEAWVWSDSPHVDNILGWKNQQTSLREWLKNEDWISERKSKPKRPKEAFEAALRKVGQMRSARLYERLASKVSVERCQDESFLEFRQTLKNWFPPDPT